MSQSLIFSLRCVDPIVVLENLDLICDSPFVSFEVSGVLFESDKYRILKDSFFKHSKSISSVFEVLPPSLSRNWVQSTALVSEELRNLLVNRLNDLASENVSFTEIDLAIDGVVKGQEVHGVVERAKNISLVLQKMDRLNTEILLPMRFPKAIPKSFEWRYTAMLINEISHSSIRSVVNVFPFEIKAELFQDFFKKTFYTTKAVRFCFDPLTDGFISREAFKSWLQVFSDQGYEGNIILSPKLNDELSLLESLKQLAILLKPYDFN